MKKYSFLSLLILAACSQQAPQNEETTESQNETSAELYQVKATAETEAVSADPEDDAADDPALWYNEADPAKSLVLGSDKTNGVDVFDLLGNRLNTHRVGRINNIDLRQTPELDLVGGSHRDSIGMDFWMVDADSLTLRYIGHVSSNLPDVYGFCMYQSPETKSLYAFVNSKTGRVEQWKLEASANSVSGELVRELKLPAQVEGMVADDSLGMVFVGVEEDGIYRFGAEPEDSTEGERIAQSGQENAAIQYDVEGLTLFYKDGNDGYLIASSQGNNTFALFERTSPHSYLGSFEIVDGEVDGAQETDGIDVSYRSFGPQYPEGIFVVQDGFNYEGEEKVAQNFKMVSWEEIVEGFK